MREKKQDSSSQSLQNLFNAAMAKANTDCIFATNKMEDYKKTSGWSGHLYFYHSDGGYRSKDTLTGKDTHKIIASYNPYAEEPRKWYFCLDRLKSIEEVKLNLVLDNNVEDPMEEQRLHDNPHYRRIWNFILQNNLVAKHMRFGNCGTRSGIVFSYLWQHASPLIKNIKYISMSYDHAFVMVNDAWIIDPWYKDGVIYPISEYDKMAVEVRKYCLEQLEDFRDLSLMESEESSWESHDYISSRVVYEVCPQDLPYPKYAHGMSVEDHYSLKNIYPIDIIDELDELEDDHREQFKSVLNQIYFFGKNLETNSKPLLDDWMSASPVLVPWPKPPKNYKQSAQSFFRKVGHACVTATEFMILGKK